MLSTPMYIIARERSLIQIGNGFLLPAHWEGGARVSIDFVAAKIPSVPARTRRKGVWGEFRRTRASRRSEAEAVSFVQNAFERSYIIPHKQKGRRTNSVLFAHVPSRGIEPLLQDPESRVLSVKLRGLHSIH